MMKKFIVTGMLCLIGTASIAQINFDFNDGNNNTTEPISPFVKEKIEEYALQVRSIVIEEKIMMNEEIAAVDSQLKENSISQPEAEIRKRQISEKYSRQINEKIAAIDFDLDEITKKQVEYTILNTDVVELSNEKEYRSLEEKYKAKHEVSGYVAYGVILLPDGDDEMLNRHLGYSSGIDAGLLYHKQLNRTSPWEFISGAYFSWRTIRFDDDYYIDRSDEGDVGLVQYNQNLEKSKLRATYLMVPVGIKFNISKLKKITDDFSYRDIDDGLGIGVNMYGGFRISKNNIMKGEDISIREKDTNYNLSNFVYGAQFTLSFDNINFFIRQDLSSYFEKNTFDDRKMMQFGVNIGF